MSEFQAIVDKASAAIANDFVAGVTRDGRKVYHVLTWQGTLTTYWYTFNREAVCFAVHAREPGDFGSRLHPDHFDIRDCTDAAVSEAVAHWSGHRPVVLS